MKITFVLPFAGLSGGVKVVAIYAQKLQQRGHEVTVVSQPARTIGFRQKLRSFIRGNGWRPNLQATSYLDFLKDQHVVLDRRRPVVNADVPDADVVIATWWETAEWVAGLHAEKGRKFYFLQGYEILPGLPKDRVVATFSLPLKKIVVSSFIRETLEKEHGCGDVGVVLNAVDLDHFVDQPRQKSKALTLGFLYQTQPSKNTQLAIDAIREVKVVFPDIRVVAFGKTTPQSGADLPSWVEFHFRPAQTLIPNLYASCDVWLFTSLEEGFGLPILEAMASATPVIGTSAGAAPDLIDGANGVLADATPEAFARAIRKFGQMSDAEWQVCSRRARETAEANSWDDAVDFLEGHFAG